MLKSSFKSAVAAAALVSASVAYATPAVNTHTYTFGTLSNSGFVTYDIEKNGSFKDTFLFSVGSDTTGEVELVSLFNFKNKGFATFNYTLTGTSGTIAPSENGWQLGAGSYSLLVSGAAKKEGGSYGFSYNVTAVPEPESYAMFLAGLGVMGAVARRRSRKN